MCLKWFCVGLIGGVLWYSPGRWYASAVMQQFFVHLLTKYNFKLADPKAELTFSYTTIVSPRPGIEILLQER